MQIPIIPFRGKNKPWYSVPRINWAHPLTKGLVFYGFHTGTGLIIDLVSGRGPVGTSIVGTPANNLSSKFGTALRYTSGGQYFWFPVSNNVNKWFVSSNYSLACAWYITALPTLNFTAPFNVTDPTANAFAVSCSWFSAGNTDMQFNVANVNATTFTGNSINTFHSFLGTNTSATSQNVYFDGKFQITTANTATFTTSTTSATFNSDQNSAGAAANGVNGWVYYGGIWNRTMSALEAFILHNDPYCFLIYPEDEMFATLVGSTPSLVNTVPDLQELGIFRRYNVIGY